MGEGVTRRGFLRAAGAGVAWVSLAGALGCEPDEEREGADAAARRQNDSSVSALPPARPGSSWAFRSRPDLNPPAITVGTPVEGTAPGYVFIAPKKGPGRDGSMIVDDDGDPVWFRPVRSEEQDAMDFKVQRYRGEPVLTWWEGVQASYGQGEYVICDAGYREVARVRAGNGLDGDHHEFLITGRDTALITIYDEIPHDLSPLGGPTNGMVAEGIIQEVEISTGEVIFQWRSLEHVPVTETYGDLPDAPATPFDYFHINSIDVDDDDNLLVSARRTFTVYKIDRASGEVVWRLGGKRSDFGMGEGTETLYQHDARRQANGAVSIFDNGGIYVSEESRVVEVLPDTETMTATVARETTHPDAILSATQGNAQALPNGNVFVGWGSEPVFSEFSGDGGLIFSARLPAGVDSYRAFRHPWTGRPDTFPDLAAARAPDGGVTLYASWNGATGVESWEVLAGPALDGLYPVGSVARTGFETAIAVRTDAALIGVRALDGAGRELGVSRAIDIRGQAGRAGASVAGTGDAPDPRDERELQREA